jgi:hypothetical protein
MHDIRMSLFDLIVPGPLTLLKVDTTSAFQHLTAKPKEIECCDEYQWSVLRGKSHRRART